MSGMITTNIDAVVRDFERDVVDTTARNLKDPSLRPMFGTGQWGKAPFAPSSVRHTGHVQLLSSVEVPVINFVVERAIPNADKFDILVDIPEGTVSTGIVEYNNGQLVRKEQSVTYQTVINRLVEALRF